MARYGIDVPEKWTSPKILEWARTEIGLTEHEAANLIAAEPATIRSWERGTLAPTFDELRKLAELYDCPLGYFFLDSPPTAAQRSLDYRGLDQGKADRLRYETRRQLRRFVWLTDYARTLIASLEVDWPVYVPEVDSHAAPEDVAEQAVASLGVTPEMRAGWPTSEDAFNGWRAAIEEQGVLVFCLKLESGDMRGVSLWETDHPPAILANHSDVEAAAGRIFTLLHEYAHLLLRRAGIVCDFRGSGEQRRNETFANKFAASVLVPRRALEKRLSELDLHNPRPNWGESTLDKIREPFHASRDTILIQLEEMGLAEEGTYRHKRAAWDMRRPFGRGRPRPGLTKARRRYREFGRNFSRLLGLADRSEAVSRSELASLVDMKVERVEEFLTLAA